MANKGIPPHQKKKIKICSYRWRKLFCLPHGVTIFHFVLQNHKHNGYLCVTAWKSFMLSWEVFSLCDHHNFLGLLNINWPLIYLLYIFLKRYFTMLHDGCMFIAEARETSGGWKKTPTKKFPGNSKVSELYRSALEVVTMVTRRRRISSCMILYESWPCLICSWLALLRTQVKWKKTQQTLKKRV